MIIQEARSTTELDMMRDLFREYEQFLQVDLCFQNFEQELANLPGKYAPPDGALLLALRNEQPVGCVALRKWEEGICEMKRLFVKPAGRGTGLGKKLAEQIITVARQRGYMLMRLDTLETLTEAVSLYQRLGFRQVPPYYDNPLPGALYWELDLRACS
ncbi:MAG: GNAT family N-acetyltransferase [Desulfoarculaceae bacterium]|nr:GNAT family N-acetyltransferase [Desulfoarculaceae bacterium]